MRFFEGWNKVSTQKILNNGKKCHLCEVFALYPLPLAGGVRGGHVEIGRGAGTGPPPAPPASGRGEEAFPLALEISYAKNRRSEEHTSELQSLMRTSYAVFCLKKKKYITQTSTIIHRLHKAK